MEKKKKPVSLDVMLRTRMAGFAIVTIIKLISRMAQDRGKQVP